MTKRDIILRLRQNISSEELKALLQEPTISRDLWCQILSRFGYRLCKKMPYKEIGDNKWLFFSFSTFGILFNSALALMVLLLLSLMVPSYLITIMYVLGLLAFIMLYLRGYKAKEKVLASIQTNQQVKLSAEPLGFEDFF